eukprot:COSAG04_NODE_659_length_11458_cov_3.404173_3_plen_85_part_00
MFRTVPTRWRPGLAEAGTKACSQTDIICVKIAAFPHDFSIYLFVRADHQTLRTLLFHIFLCFHLDHRNFELEGQLRRGPRVVPT